jgi:magnesium chelatase family protein
MEKPCGSRHAVIAKRGRRFGAGLVSGRKLPTLGEISLAHRGVQFLDELPEFAQKTLEVMRQALEDGVVTISAARGTLPLDGVFKDT